MLRLVLCYQSRSVTYRSQTKGGYKKNDKCWTELRRGGRGGRGQIRKNIQFSKINLSENESQECKLIFVLQFRFSQ